MNNYAISTDGIATALQSSASALVTAGNDIDEAIALVTAGNTITQDPKKVGTGLRTIALRLTGTKEAKKELEEMGEDVEGMYETQAKLREDIMNATQVASNNFQGFDILNDNGNYKSTYEILLGIADIYDEILAKDKEQGTNFSNFLLEAMAGKTRANILASIFQNADVLRESFEDSQNSFGSAMEENDKYLQSISGHIARLSNSYQELWATSTNRETVNFFIDLANAVVSAAAKLGLLKTALLAVTGITILKGGISKKGLAGSLISGLGSFAHLDGDTSTLAATMNTLAENSSNTGKSFSLLSILSPQLSRGFARIKDAAAGLWQIIKSTAGSVWEFIGANKMISVAIAVAAAAIGAYILTYDKLNRSYKDTVEEVKQIRKEYNAAQSEIKDHAKAISEVSDEYERLSKGVNSETNANLSLSTDEYERYLEICNQIADMYPELVKGYDSQGNAILTLKGNVEGLTQALINEKKAAAEAAINGGEAGDANSIMDAWRHVVNGRQTGYNREMSAVDSVDYLNRVLNWDLKQAGTFMDQISAGTEYDAQGLVQKYSQALINGKQEEIQLARKAIVEEINAMNMEVEQRLSDVKFLGNLYLTNGDDFYKLSERGQTMGNLLVEGMTQSMAEGFIDGEKGLDKTRVDAWTDSIIRDIQKIDSIKGFGKDTNGKDKTLLDNIFEFKTEDKTLSEIRNFRQKAIDAFSEAGASKENTLDFFEQIGLTEDKILDARSRAINAIHTLVNKDLSDEMTSFNFGELLSDMTADQMEAFIEVANSSNTASEALQKWNDLKKVSISISEDMAGALEEEQGKITGIQTALSEATSATGLTFGNKNYLQGLFGSMEDFDYDEMFKRTATGIKIDERLLNNLNVERAKNELAEYNNSLAATLSEEQRITEAMRNVEVGSEAYATGQKNLELLRERKQLLAEEITQYEALISTYNRWIQAQSQADQRSNWESMASGFERVDQLVNAGFIGDAEVRSWIDLMTYEDMATASVEEYMETYKTLYNTIEGTSYSIKDFFIQGENGGLDASGLYNFIDALKQLEQSLGQDFADFDNMTIDVSNIDAIAKALNISKEAANELAFALEDIGWDVIGQQAIEAVADANRALEQLNANGIFDENGHHIEYQIDFDTTNTAALDSYISDIRAKLDEFRNEDETINLNAEGAKDLVTILDYLTQRLDDISQSRKVQIETNAQEAYEKLSKLEEFKEYNVGFTLDSNNLTYVENMISNLLSLKEKLSEESNINVRAENLQAVDQLLDAFLLRKQEITGEDVTFSVYANGVEETNQQLQRVKQTADETNGKTSTITVNEAGAEETTTKIKEASSAADEANGKDATITYHSDTSEIDGATEKIKQNRAEAEAPVVQKVEQEVVENLVLDTTQAEADKQAFASEVVEAKGTLNITVEKDQVEEYVSGNYDKDGKLTVTVDKPQVDEYMATDYNKKATLSVNVATNSDKVAGDGDYDVKATVAYGIDDKAPKKYKPDDKQATVIYDKNSTIPDNYVPKNKSATVSYGIDPFSPVYAWEPPTKRGTVVYNARMSGSPFVDGTAITKGHAYVSGTAFAKGDWGTKNSGTALGGELGTELLVRDGKWQTIGEDGAEFFNYRRGDIIFNADQTRQLFEKGKIESGKKRGTAYSEGTISGSGLAFASGEENKKERELISTTDYVERIINKFAKAIERLDKVVEDTTRSWGTRNNNLIEEIKQTNKQIENQRSAVASYQRHIDWLRGVYGLDDRRINMIKNGEWLIESLFNMSENTGNWGSAEQREIEDKNTRKYLEGFQQYTEFYDKMVEAQDAIADLTSSIREMFIQMFDQISTKFEEIRQDYDYTRSVLEERVSRTETAGNIVSEKYYNALIANENKTLTQYYKQREQMIVAFNQLVKNGTIVSGSEEWYRIRNDINEITIAIEESESALVEFATSIRDIRWEKFDRLQQSLDDIVNESDFLIDLLEGELDSLYDKESGLLTDYGMAALGLHESNYEVYIAQAKKYADEIKKINSDLAKDPSNQAIIDRRQELLESQRDTIKAAQDEKNTIKDLMTNTIEREVDTLKDLIKTYTDTLQAEKNLYNYQKNIRDKSQQVNSIRKQLSAYENDDSEEGRAKRQQLEAQLKDAEEALKDTQYDHYFTEHKELLDNLYSEYEKQAKERANNTNTLIKDTINAINNNSASITDTINKLAASYGYTLTDTEKTVIQKDASGKTDTVKNTATAINNTVKQNDAITNTANSNANTNVLSPTTPSGNSRADGWFDFNGKRYYIKNGKSATGLTDIDGKKYYFNSEGQAQTGQQNINGKWYYFDEKTGAALTNQFKYIKDQNKTVYYDGNGQMIHGWGTVGNKKYYFDPSTGAMATGEKKISGKQYYFDNNGALLTNTTKKIGNKVYVLDSNGQKLTGAAGWKTLGNKKYYIDNSGAVATGYKTIDKTEYLFNKDTGALEKTIGTVPKFGWKRINGKDYWYENYQRQGLEGRGKEIYDPGSDAWYWLDSIYDGAKAVNKEVYMPYTYNGKDNIGKWVRYDSQGHMIKGWYSNNKGTYYYDPITGAMYHGEAKIDGRRYSFDPITGILLRAYKHGAYKIDEDQLAWTQENKKAEAIIRPSDGAILTPLAKGDSVLNSKATANLFDFANDPQKFLRELKSGLTISPKVMSGSKDVNITNDVNLQVVLPNVQNYEEFKYALQHDKNFENMIRSMTTDKMFGGSSLAKYKFA